MPIQRRRQPRTRGSDIISPQDKSVNSGEMRERRIDSNKTIQAARRVSGHCRSALPADAAAARQAAGCFTGGCGKTSGRLSGSGGMRGKNVFSHHGSNVSRGASYLASGLRRRSVGRSWFRPSSSRTRGSGHASSAASAGTVRPFCSARSYACPSRLGVSPG